MEAILDQLIKALGWSIFHSLWQGGTIYILLALIVYLFPGMNSRLKHNIAYSSLIVIFIAFVGTFYSVFNIPSPVSSSETLSVVGSGLTAPNATLGWANEIYKLTEQVFPMLVAFYTIGLLIQFFILCKGYLKLGKLRKIGISAVPEHWQSIFNDLLSKLDLRQTIEFRISSMINVPLVLGYLKPIVLFPISLVSQLDPIQVEAILIHELSHIRRNDYLLNLIKTAIETILFFNPFVWLGSRLIEIEREHSCDDLVIALTGTPITYAHALLKLEILKENGSPILTMASTGRKNHLYQRIKRITDMKTNYMNSKQQVLTIALTIACIFSLAWISPLKKKDNNVQKVKSHTNQIADLSKSISNKSLTAIMDTIPNKSKKADTTKKTYRSKIVFTDSTGRKVVYNSVAEVPDSLKSKLTKFPNFDFKFKDFDVDFKDFDVDFKSTYNEMDSSLQSGIAYLKSPGFAKEIAAAATFMNSDEYKKGMREAISYMDSPEYKKAMRDAANVLSSPEFKKELRKSMEATNLYLKSPEGKKQQLESLQLIEELKKGTKSDEYKSAMDVYNKNIQELKLEYSDKDSKKQTEASKDLKNSEEYKKLKKQFEKDLEKLREKKGLKPGR